MSESVPVCTNLSDIYGPQELETARKRFLDIRETFKKTFNVLPELYARSPGRVNLIGEHIDYEGYAVLPMAIRQDTVMAIGRGKKPKLVIANTENDKFPLSEFDLNPLQAMDMNNHSWSNYVLAAYKGVFEYLNGRGEAPEPQGLRIVVDGQVPQGSGLSSSSALVCASSLAISSAYGFQIPKQDLAELSATCERHVGTQSGGMDQAISVMARAGYAKLIEFNPVRGIDVALPLGGTFVVANSMAVSKKAESANYKYNLRVVECRIAAVMLAQKLGIVDSLTYKTLDQIEKFLCNKGRQGAAKFAFEHLHEGSYSVQEIDETIGISLKKLFEQSPSALKVLATVGEAKGFKLRDRALHVFAEAQRVHDFRKTCEAQICRDEKLVKLGLLMNASHASCRDLYECSCPELEKLVMLAKSAGAYGTRLTGAGWGGCTVSLVREDGSAQFIERLKKEYYGFMEPGACLDELVFSSTPSSGSAIFRTIDAM